MSTIVGIGANVFDNLITVPHYPEEDTKRRATAIKPCGGGPCGTGLVTAAKLGESAAYIGALAKDSGGDFLMADMLRFGVDVSLVDRVEGATSFASYVILSEDSASRTCVFVKENLPAFVLDDKKIQAISEAKVLMVDGNELDNAVSGAKIAKEKGTAVLYDAGGLYDGVASLLALTDILIPSEEFALGHTGMKHAEDAAKKLYELYAPKVVVVTQGVKGGIIYDGKVLSYYPSFHVDAKDSNGAGDVFHGAFAFAYAKGYTYDKAAVFSSAVSAIKCTRFGARDGVPAYKEVIDFLKERGYNEFEKDME